MEQTRPLQRARRFLTRCLSSVIAACVAAGAVGWAVEPAADVAVLLRDLDADQFDVRQRAATELARMASEPTRHAELADLFQQLLRTPETSFEVRAQIAVLRRALPAAAAAPPNEVSEPEIDRLFNQLDASSHAVRLGAADRLIWLLRQPQAASLVLIKARGRLAAAGLSAETRRQLQELYDNARGVWLTSDPAAFSPLPAVSPEQIESWLTALTAPGQAIADEPLAGGAALAGAAADRAEQELLDLLARDEHVAAVTQSLEVRLTNELDVAAETRVRRLLGWTRPAMVAEYWQSGRHLGIQHLLIDVPSQAELAVRPSHFDRIDDQSAHCVSGNALSPGDYPVGVLFPHPDPQRPDAQFHLVNLPTPRQRMAYEHLVKLPDGQRLAALSAKSLDRLLAQNRRLSLSETRMLIYLNPDAVSRFVGPYFQSVDDAAAPTVAAGEVQLDMPQPHATVCQVLAQAGAPAAIPALMEAIEGKRFAEPTAADPYDWPWLAALAIASRDPRPETDAWLADLIERESPLRIAAVEPAELGATAAALLLRRAQVAPAEFGLMPVDDASLGDPLPAGYRFRAPEQRKKLLRWWAERQGVARRDKQQE